MKDKEFVHLHVHTDYSLLDGCSRIDRLCEKAVKIGQKSLAITDHGALFGIVDFYKKAKRYDIKPLLGCEINLVNEEELGTTNSVKYQKKSYHMGLIAKNSIGYKNLIKLVSLGRNRNARVSLRQLAEYAYGLIGFSGCLSGVIPQFLLEENYIAAKEACKIFVDIFSNENYFIELMDHGIEDQSKIIPGLLKIASEFNLKAVATNDVHYVNKSDWKSHDALLCIQTGAKLSEERRIRYNSRQFYLKSREQMEVTFIHHDIKLLTNTLLVAEICDTKLTFEEDHSPIYNIPAYCKYECDTYNFNRILNIYVDKKNAVLKRSGKNTFVLSTKHRVILANYGLFLFSLCKYGLLNRYGIDYDNSRAEISNGYIKKDKLKLINKLEYELAIIIGTGFVDYFLIVWDLIKWARNHSIPVGPGRGSGAGCLVAYVLYITDIDPLRFGLLFERMLNLERVSPPDFDVDFCMRRRVYVVRYVREKYGIERVANIITFGTFGAKMIIRDLARIHYIPYAEADKIAKMIPYDINISLENAVCKSSDFRKEIKNNTIVAEIIDLGKVIEGMVRNISKHACGIIIADQPITNLIPVCIQEGYLTTQYSKEPSEELGLLKCDFLGLKTLTVIVDAQESIRRIKGYSNFDIKRVSLEDYKTFNILNTAKTVGIFQLESSGMQSLCRQLDVSSIDDIVALIAIYRPGPMQFIPQYIKGKKNHTTIVVPHYLLKNLVKETYGVIIYQEQVMEAARILAGYTLGGADLLRRAMGKKNQDVMNAQKDIFIKGAAKTNNIPQKKAEYIFSILAKFAKYGFNKSHSTAYAILSYRTAFLKANFTTEFMSAVLSSELGNTSKVANFIEEAKSIGILVLGPDINESREMFTAISDKNDPSLPGIITFGLAAIKGVGNIAASSIINERNKNGIYTDFNDFIFRTDLHTVNRRVIEHLVRTGAFDFTAVDRKHLLDSYSVLLGEAIVRKKDLKIGQTSLFNIFHSSYTKYIFMVNNNTTMSLTKKLSFEKELLGDYVSVHPMNLYYGLDSIISTPLLKRRDNAIFRLCGVIHHTVIRITKIDSRLWATFTLSTTHRFHTIHLYSSYYSHYLPYLKDGIVACVEGELLYYSQGQIISAKRILRLDYSLSTYIKTLTFGLLNKENILCDFLNHIYVLSSTLKKIDAPTLIQFSLYKPSSKSLVAKIPCSFTCQLTTEGYQQLCCHKAVIRVYINTWYTTYKTILYRTKLGY